MEVKNAIVISTIRQITEDKFITVPVVIIPKDKDTWYDIMLRVEG